MGSTSFTSGMPLQQVQEQQALGKHCMTCAGLRVSFSSKVKPQTLADALPPSPALSPPTASLPEEAPRLSRLFATHSAAAWQSSTAAGKGCSGASLHWHLPMSSREMPNPKTASCSASQHIIACLKCMLPRGTIALYAQLQCTFYELKRPPRSVRAHTRLKAHL